MTRRISFPDIITQLPLADSQADSAEPIGRLLLYAKGNAVNEGLVRAGHYGIPEAEKVIDLGDAVDIIPLARRPQALDLSNVDGVIAVYDPESPEFKRIAAQSLEYDSDCMCGVSFLVFERTTRRFLEFFCGTKSTRAVAGNIYPFLPQTAADIDRLAVCGRDVSKLVPRGPSPLTLKSHRIKKKSFIWYVPMAVECSTPFADPPSPKEMAKEIQAFVDKVNQAEHRSPSSGRENVVSEQAILDILRDVVQRLDRIERRMTALGS